MRLAIFDLDNTLLAGDSDHAWGQFVCREGLVEPEDYSARNDAFYQDYLNGRLDVRAYQDFCQELLGRSDPEQLAEWHCRFMQDFIEPIVLTKGEALVRQHREAGDLPMIITATNRFITEPIARRLGVEVLLATECEMQNGRYTGRSTDIPCFQAGKVERLQRWLGENGHNLDGAFFYSDSHNDLPLLQQVTHPIAVDPDDTLRAEAEKRGWKVISLRGDG